jgi:glycopeptide antibiotics resistance protein
MLRIKAALPRIRPLLHALMLFAPTLAVLFLISRNRTLLLGGTASLGVELAQYLFGFGFDRTDFLDLLWNAAGIALALWIHPILHKKLRRPPAPATIA